MARLIGINLPDDKRIEYALTLLYGVSWARSKDILAQAKVDKDTRVKDLTEADLKALQDYVEKAFKLEGDLKEEISMNMKRLKEVGSYRGVRHMRGLPSRGQRTRSNARTKRGKRKTVGAMKKEDMVRLQQATTAKK